MRKTSGAVLLLFIFTIIANDVLGQGLRLKNQFESYNDSLYEKALEMQLKNDDVEALNLLNHINTGVPYYNQVLYLKMLINYRKLNYTEVSRLSKELRLYGDGNIRNANVFDAVLAYREGELDKALQLLNENLELTPHTDYISQLYKGIVLFEKGSYDESIEILEAFVKNCFINYEAHYFLAEAYMKKGRVSEAVLAYSTGAIYAKGESLNDFLNRLTQIAELDSFVTRFKPRASNKFSKSDQLLTATAASEMPIDSETGFAIAWSKMLDMIVSNNKVSDAMDVTHQLYLNFFQPKLVTDIKTYPYVVLYSQADVYPALEKYFQKNQDKLLKTRELLIEEGMMIGGTRILDAARRSKADGIQHIVFFQNSDIMADAYQEIILSKPLPLEDIDDVILGKRESSKKVYVNGYLKRRINEANKEAMEYYDMSEQVHKVWNYKNLYDYHFEVFTKQGIKIMDEVFEDNQLVSLQYNYPFGQKFRVHNKTDYGYDITTYHLNGQVMQKFKSYSSFLYSKGLDTFSIKYDKYGKVEESIIKDNDNNVMLYYKNRGDIEDLYKYMDQNKMQLTEWQNGKKILERENDGHGIITEKEYYEDGTLKKDLTLYDNVLNGQVFSLYRPDGKLYGFVDYRNKKMNGGYMLSPQHDTLWSYNNAKNKERLEVYDALGVLDYTIQLGYDGSIFPEMNYYYANGKIKEYRAKNKEDENRDFTEIEERFLSGNLKSSSESSEDGALTYYKGYYPNGNLQFENTYFYGKEMNIYTSYYLNGIKAFTGQNDFTFGFYGDTHSYGLDGKLNKTSNSDKDCKISEKAYAKGELIYLKQLESGIDTVKVFNEKGREIGFEVYKNGVNYGVGKQYFKNGNIREMSFYNHNGDLDSLATYYINGKLARTVKYDRKGIKKRIGREITGLESNIYSKEYTKGYKAYTFENGIKLILNEDGDILDAMVVVQDSDTLFYSKINNQGVVKVQCRNKNNILENRMLTAKDAKITAYHTNGKEALVLPLEKYVITGDMLLNYKTGKPVLKSQWKDNMFHGAFVWYFPSGALTEKQFFDYGLPTKSYEFWDETGKKLVDIQNYGTDRQREYYWNETTQRMEEED